MIFEIFLDFFLMGAGPDPAIWAGPKLARPKDNLIILPLHAEMDGFCMQRPRRRRRRQCREENRLRW